MALLASLVIFGWASVPSAAFGVPAPADYASAPRLLMPALKPPSLRPRQRSKQPAPQSEAARPAKKAAERAAAKATQAAAPSAASGVPAPGVVPPRVRSRFARNGTCMKHKEVELMIKPVQKAPIEASLLQMLEDYRKGARSTLQVAAFGPWRDHRLRVQYKTSVSPQAISKLCMQLQLGGNPAWTGLSKHWARGLAEEAELGKVLR